MIRFEASKTLSGFKLEASASAGDTPVDLPWKSIPVLDSEESGKVA